MAYRLIKNSNHYSSCMGKQYQCDFLNDIGKLPTSKELVKSRKMILSVMIHAAQDQNAFVSKMVPSGY